jgi:hypothetical protein
VLELIASKMGKRARTLCCHLKQVYGSPGASLRLPWPARDEALAGVTCISGIQSWQHPVQRLEVGGAIELDGSSRQVIAESLPGLRELQCRRFSGTTATLPATPLTALTSLHVCVMDAGLPCITAFAPCLRSLRIGEFAGGAWVELGKWGDLEALTGLQSLDLPRMDLDLPITAMLFLTRLTRLTHLALHFHPYEEMEETFTRVLSALPALSSIKIKGFRNFGPALGPVLQAMQLTRLELADDDAGEHWDGFPDVLAMMPLLAHLTLHGQAVIDLAELLGSAGSVPLGALELRSMGPGHLPAACDVLARTSELTTLVFTVEVGPDTPHCTLTAQQERRVCEALARNTRLQHLDLWVPAGASLASWLADVPGALTRLELCISRWEVTRSDLDALARLSRLTTLALIATATAYRGTKLLGAKDTWRGLCMEAVKKLPLLEEATLGAGQWTEEEVQRLLPPPEGLRRLHLYSPRQYYSRHLDAAIRRLEAFDVSVAVTTLDRGDVTRCL